MKICLVSPKNPRAGGISRWTEIILEQFKFKNIEYTHVDTGPKFRKPYDNSLFLRCVNGLAQIILDLYLYIKNLIKGPDVIHICSSGSISTIRDIIFGILGRIINKKVIYHIHHGRIPQIIRENNFETILLETMLKISSATIVITQESLNLLRKKHPSNRIKYIPNPIIEYKYNDFNIKENKSVLYVGWIIPSKGIEELISVWNEIDTNGWKLIIVGPGDIYYINNLRFRFKPRDVIFIGEVEHDIVMKYIKYCDFLVLPSYTEGFPNVILEAMSMGKPVIATDVGAIPQILDQECGIVIPVKDISSLKKAIEFFIDNRSERLRMGRNAFIKVRIKYSIDVIFPEYLNLWI